MLVVAVIVIAALYFARDIFVPVTLATLLSFALGPAVIWLRRWHFGRIPSVIVTVLFAFLVISAIGALIASQLTQLAEELPLYQTNISQKIQSIRAIPMDSGIVGRAMTMVEDLYSEIAKKPADAARLTNPSSQKAKSPQEQSPVPVEIHQPAAPLSLIQTVFEPLLQPLAAAGIIVVFVIFFLLQREDLRDRFIRLVGSGDLRRTTEALDDAVDRLSRYLLLQSAINTIFGLLIGIGAALIGIPHPVLWGTLATLLRFVPYIGAVIAALFPLAVALAVDPGWSMPLWTAGLFLVVEPVTSQIIEPLLYGHSTGLSPVAVVVAAAFWTWLWGPIGLLLSTPLTLCLVVLGRHVARLKFLDIVLGNEPALTFEENFYQRMLAGDPDEAAHQAEAFLKDKPLSAYYDEVAIKGLALARLDASRGELDHERRARIKEAVDGIIDDLSDHAVPDGLGNGTRDAKDPSPCPSELAPDWGEDAVLCVAGRDSLDEAVAAMLAQLLRKDGVGVRVLANAAVSASNLPRLDVAGVRMVCLSYLDPGDFANARYLIRRLRRKVPLAAIVVAVWNVSEEEAGRLEVLRETGTDAVVTSLQQAIDYVTAAATVHSLPKAVPTEAAPA